MVFLILTSSLLEWVFFYPKKVPAWGDLVVNEDLQKQHSASMAEFQEALFGDAKRLWGFCVFFCLVIFDVFSDDFCFFL